MLKIGRHLAKCPTSGVLTLVGLDHAPAPPILSSLESGGFPQQLLETLLHHKDAENWPNEWRLHLNWPCHCSSSVFLVIFGVGSVPSTAA